MQFSQKQLIRARGGHNEGEDWSLPFDKDGKPIAVRVAVDLALRHGGRLLWSEASCRSGVQLAFTQPGQKMVPMESWKLVDIKMVS
jgi:hypothetical protein